MPTELRMDVWNTYIGKTKRTGPCYTCERTIDVTAFEAGHVHAHALGGVDTVENLRPICGHCNRSMGKSDLEAFKQQMTTAKKAGRPVTQRPERTTKALPPTPPPTNQALRRQVWDAYFQGARTGTCYSCSVALEVTGTYHINRRKPHEPILRVYCASCNKNMHPLDMDAVHRQLAAAPELTKKDKDKCVVS